MPASKRTRDTRRPSLATSVWRKYRTQLINRVRGYEGFRIVGNAGEKALAEHVGLCLFAAFWYMHIYPTVDAISGWEFGKRTGRRFSKTKFYACVLPVIMELAPTIAAAASSK